MASSRLFRGRSRTAQCAPAPLSAFALLVSRRTPLVSRGAALVSRGAPALSGRARGGSGGNITGGGRGVGRRAVLVSGLALAAVPPLVGRRNSIGCRNAVATASPRRRACAERRCFAPSTAPESGPG